MFIHRAKRTSLPKKSRKSHDFWINFGGHFRYTTYECSSDDTIGEGWPQSCALPIFAMHLALVDEELQDEGFVVGEFWDVHVQCL